MPVTVPGHEIDPASITRLSPKKIVKAAMSAGFHVRACESETLEPGAPFKSGPKAGTLRPDKRVTHLTVTGKISGAAIFLVRFEDYSFSEAIVWDAAGWPTELYFDYAQSANAVRRVKDEPEWAWQERVDRQEREVRRRDYEYNDGEMWLNTGQRYVKTSTVFDDWLADLVPGYTVRKTRAKETNEMVSDADLLAGGEWAA
jgi:hypothetical protein